MKSNIPYIPPMYEPGHKPGVLKVNPGWAYVPPVRPSFLLNLDREETTSQPAIGIEEADRMRKAEFPIQNSNRYPSKLIEKSLIKELANKINIEENQILVGNGIMNLMTYIYDIYSNINSDVLIPTPGFWPAYTYAMQRSRGILMPLYHLETKSTFQKGYSFPIDEMEICLKKKPTICYISNPNNPTGTLISISIIEKLVSENKETLFLLDEAYGSYAAFRLNPNLDELTEGINLINRYDNIIVMRTFSKMYALANYRVGYLMSNSKNIETIKAYMGPYDMSEICLAMAYYNLKYNSYTKEILKNVTQNMDTFMNFLEDNSVTHYGGYRNSILVEGLNIAAAYEENQIAVRSMVYQAGIPNPIMPTFRITIPSDIDNFNLLMDISKKILAPHD